MSLKVEAALLAFDVHCHVYRDSWNFRCGINNLQCRSKLRPWTRNRHRMQLLYHAFDYWIFKFCGIYWISGHSRKIRVGILPYSGYGTAVQTAGICCHTNTSFTYSILASLPGSWNAHLEMHCEKCCDIAYCPLSSSRERLMFSAVVLPRGLMLHWNGKGILKLLVGIRY